VVTAARQYRDAKSWASAVNAALANAVWQEVVPTVGGEQ